MKLSINILGPIKRSNKTNDFFDCPFCNDTKGHLGVHRTKKIFSCFKCGSSGRVENLDIPVSEFRSRVNKFLHKEPKPTMNTISLSLPEFYKPIEKGSGIAYEYLKKRMVTLEEIKRFKIGFCNGGVFQDRIIVPIYNDHRLVFYVGRTYLNRVPKYLNAPVPKNGTIFKTFDGRVKLAVITEGVFDALRVGKVAPAISLLGKIVNGKAQAQSIFNSADKVLVMFDKDAVKDCVLAAMELSIFVLAKPVFIDKKDPGEMTLDEIKKYVD